MTFVNIRNDIRSQPIFRMTFYRINQNQPRIWRATVHLKRYIHI